jgi:GTP diphosphokinase / guanosine-3',5'-bis(diphosphate) 3'-diphosphatase
LNPVYDSNGLLLAALGFAADKHRNQRRKDHEATPYINHPIALAVLLNQEGGISDVTVLCAALLHDIIEDTGVTVDDLQERFGAEIADLVVEVTDDKSLDKAERKRLQIENAGGLSDAAKLIKLADKICNLRDIAAIPPADWTVERKREYCEFAKRVVDGLRGIHPALEAKFDQAYSRLVGDLG